MTRHQLEAKLAEIRRLRAQTLTELNDLTEADFALEIDMTRWDDARRILLRFGDHMREHTTHLTGTRAKLDRQPSMPQRILAQAEVAWGELLAATVGLTDDDLALIPPDAGWSIAQILDHITEIEESYLNKIRTARQQHRAETGASE